MRGDERTRIHRMVFGAQIFTVWFCVFPVRTGPTDVAGEWRLAQCPGDRRRDSVETIAAGKLTAVLVLKHSAWRVDYLEAGFAVHLLTQSRIGNRPDPGWCFQFGDLIGAGRDAGSRGQYAIGVRLQHVPPHDGFTSFQGVLRCRL